MPHFFTVITSKEKKSVKPKGLFVRQSSMYFCVHYNADSISFQRPINFSAFYPNDFFPSCENAEPQDSPHWFISYLFCPPTKYGYVVLFVIDLKILKWN